jgi:hypothetical protein
MYLSWPDPTLAPAVVHLSFLLAHIVYPFGLLLSFSLHTSSPHIPTSSSHFTPCTPTPFSKEGSPHGRALDCSVSFSRSFSFVDVSLNLPLLSLSPCLSRYIFFRHRNALFRHSQFSTLFFSMKEAESGKNVLVSCMINFKDKQV